MQKKSLRQYLKGAIEGYAKDPADSEFQIGYRACLLEIERCRAAGVFEGEK